MAANPIKLEEKITDPYEMTINITHVSIPKTIKSPVGQIVTLGEKSELKEVKRFCSGFNINEGRYFLTAGHCITSSYAQEGMLTCFRYDEKSPMPQGKCFVSFGYEAPPSFDHRIHNVSIPENIFQIEEIVVHGYCEPAQIDYGVLRLSNGAQDYGYLDFANFTPELNSEISIIHHPKRMPKRYSKGTVTGYNHNYSRFIHNAATYGGSSGSPVLSQHQVVGVHVSGAEYQYENKDIIQKNEAVIIDKILDDAKKNGHYKFFRPPESSNAIATNGNIRLNHPSMQHGGCPC